MQSHEPDRPVFAKVIEQNRVMALHVPDASRRRAMAHARPVPHRARAAAGRRAAGGGPGQRAGRRPAPADAHADEAAARL
eukprot:103600-Rhodomonas_salina.1